MNRIDLKKLNLKIERDMILYCCCETHIVEFSISISQQQNRIIV